MLTINFLGSPCSGKTTLAARVFAKLKESAVNAEFVPEFARRFIATHGPSALTESGQIEIMRRQLDDEQTFVGKDTVTVSESSPLNACLYLKNLNNPEVKSLLERIRVSRSKQKVLYFFCRPVKATPILKDTLRVHDEQEIVQINSRAQSVFETLDIPAEDFIYLSSDSLDERVANVMATILNKLGETC